MTEYVADLVLVVKQAALRLKTLPEEDAARRPSPDRWSIQEIIGHLVDSAANNHQRFVRARWQDHLIFGGYAQEDWVAAQAYNASPWLELLHLWESYNLHLARVMKAVPEAVRLTPRERHNLDVVAFRPPSAGTPATLDYLMSDYVQHLKHHLRQIDAIRNAMVDQ